jgi:molybdopterin-guanine dinucleotide biosynthesis protein A
VFDAIILAGGSSERLGGEDKPAVDINGTTLLDRAVAAAKGAARIVVVGPRRETAHPVEWAEEDPLGGGPVAAIAAALPSIDQDYVLVLAADLPWVGGAVPFLLTAASKTEVAVLADQGRRHYLAAVWNVEALRDAVDALPRVQDAAARELYEGRQIMDVPDQENWSVDCDTWDDIEAARKVAES